MKQHYYAQRGHWFSSLTVYPRCWGIGIELELQDEVTLCFTIGPLVIYAGRVTTVWGDDGMEEWAQSSPDDAWMK